MSWDLPDSTNFAVNHSVDIPEIRSLVEVQLQKYPPTATYILDSLGEMMQNTSVYIGAGGNVYMLWRLNRLLGGYEAELR
jgi:hypothetical protein